MTDETIGLPAHLWLVMESSNAMLSGERRGLRRAGDVTASDRLERVRSVAKQVSSGNVSLTTESCALRLNPPPRKLVRGQIIV